MQKRWLSISILSSASFLDVQKFCFYYKTLASKGLKQEYNPTVFDNLRQELKQGKKINKVTNFLKKNVVIRYKIDADTATDIATLRSIAALRSIFFNFTRWNLIIS